MRYYESRPVRYLLNSDALADDRGLWIITYWPSAGRFLKADTSPDAVFYVQPRFVNDIDAGAIAAVTALYRDMLPEGGAILDLMSSWVSHLPKEAAYGGVTGLGINAAELAANPRFTPASASNARPVKARLWRRLFMAPIKQR